MKNKSWIFGLVVVVVAIAALGIWGFKTNTDKSAAKETLPATTAAYYDDNAPVMEFYQDTCSWCIKQQTVLAQLAAEGYKVKSMNIGANHPENQSWWKDYNVSGTPVFIAKNGDRAEGYQTYEKLKAFLDAHKD